MIASQHAPQAGAEKRNLVVRFFQRSRVGKTVLGHCAQVFFLVTHTYAAAAGHEEQQQCGAEGQTTPAARVKRPKVAKTALHACTADPM